MCVILLFGHHVHGNPESFQRYLYALDTVTSDLRKRVHHVPMMCPELIRASSAFTCRSIEKNTEPLPGLGLFSTSIRYQHQPETSRLGSTVQWNFRDLHALHTQTQIRTNSQEEISRAHKFSYTWTGSTAQRVTLFGQYRTNYAGVSSYTRGVEYRYTFAPTAIRSFASLRYQSSDTITDDVSLTYFIAKKVRFGHTNNLELSGNLKWGKRTHLAGTQVDGLSGDFKAKMAVNRAVSVQVKHFTGHRHKGDSTALGVRYQPKMGRYRWSLKFGIKSDRSVFMAISL